jgi:eukaryotic-like serine/threonine-protein kinase
MADARVSHYRIVKQLGAGGMGVVYEAVDEHSGRTVVIKAIKEPRPDPDAVRRFEREGRAAAAVKHENVVQIFDAGVAPNGHPFLVVELVSGGSLSDRLKGEGPLPWREAATVGAAIARGLGAIHRAGLVHRDMKPANVMLAADGTPKIGDLGLVRADAATGLTKGGLTKTGELMGTLEFIAPEQAEGSRAIDGRTDLYSFGATLHALIAGRPPFEGGGIVLVKKHLMDAPPALSSIIGDVPPALDALVLKLLEKEPDARPASADEVAAALDAIAAGEAGGSRASRGPLVAIAGGLVVVLASIGAAAWLGTRGASPPDRATGTTSSLPAPATTSTVTKAQEGPAPKVGPWSDEGGLRVTRIMGGEAPAHAREVRGLAVTRTLVVSGSLDGTLGLFDETGAARGAPRPASPDVDPIAALALTRDGRVLTAHESSDVRRWTLSPDTPPEGVAGAGRNDNNLPGRRMIDVDPQGRYAIAGVDNLIRMTQPDGTKHESLLMSAKGKGLHSVALIGGLVVAANDEDVICWRARSSSWEPGMMVADEAGARAYLSIRPASLIATRDRDGVIVGDAAGGLRKVGVSDTNGAVSLKEEPASPMHREPVHLLALCPSANLGASASEGITDRSVKVWRASSFEVTATLDLGPGDRATALAWHPTAKWLAVGTQQGYVLRVELTRAD